MTASLHIAQPVTSLGEHGRTLPLTSQTAAMIQALPMPLPDFDEAAPVALTLCDGQHRQLWQRATTPRHAAWLAVTLFQAPELAAILAPPEPAPARPAKLAVEHQGGWAVFTPAQWVEMCLVMALTGGLTIPPHLRRAHIPDEVRPARQPGGVLRPEWRVIDLIAWGHGSALRDAVTRHLAESWGVALPVSAGALPIPVAAKLGAARWLGVSGSRDPDPALLPPLLAALAALSPEGTLHVGARPNDWGGVDSLVREVLAASDARPVLLVERAERNDWQHLIARSQDLALAVASGGPSAGLLVAFPSKPWPLALAPSRRWPRGGFGGTLGTLAVAVGNGAEALVYVDDGSVPGPAWGGRWLGDGWWLVGGGEGAGRAGRVP